MNNPICEQFRFIKGGRVIRHEWHFPSLLCSTGSPVSQFVGDLLLEYVDGHDWRLIAPFSFIDAAGVIYTVPAGFVTDFATIPRWLWSVLPPTGSYGPAATVHDFLVSSKIVPRDKADAIFYEALTVLKVGECKRWILYRGVRIGTWWSKVRGK